MMMIINDLKGNFSIKIILLIVDCVKLNNKHFNLTLK